MSIFENNYQEICSLQKESGHGSGKTAFCALCGGESETICFRGRPVCRKCLEIIRTLY